MAQDGRTLLPVSAEGASELEPEIHLPASLARPRKLWSAVGVGAAGLLCAGLAACACVRLRGLRGDASAVSLKGDPFEVLLDNALFDVEDRELFDVSLFDTPNVPYSSHPEEAKVVMTSCVIDVTQAALYLGNAIVYIYRAAICPDTEPLGCTEPVAYAITALTWLGAFLASAASSCAESLHPASACVAATLRDLAAAGSTIFGIKEDCFLTKPLDDSRVYQEPRHIPYKLQKIWSLARPFPPAERRLSEFVQGASDASPDADTELYRQKAAEIRHWLRNSTSKRPDAQRKALPSVLFDARTHGIDPRVLGTDPGFDRTIEKIRNISRLSNRGTERSFALANCVFNSVDAVAWLIRALLSIYDAARSCGDRKECGVDVLFVIGSFAYTAQMMSMTFVDCPHRGKREALCGANIADVVGSMSIFVASIIQAISFCSDAWPKRSTLL